MGSACLGNWQVSRKGLFIPLISIHSKSEFSKKSPWFPKNRLPVFCVSVKEKGDITSVGWRK